MNRLSGPFVAAGMFVLVFLFGGAGAARADLAGGAPTAESVSIQAAGAALRVTLDKSEIVHLDAEIGSIIVGNPLPASVLMDTEKSLIVVPKTTGVTHVTVLGKNGLVLMDRHIIVDAPKPDYVRIRTTCIGKEKGCTPNRSFYCPEGRCAEIVVPELTESEDSTASDTEKAAMDAVAEESSGASGETAGSEAQAQ